MIMSKAFLLDAWNQLFWLDVKLHVSYKSQLK